MKSRTASLAGFIALIFLGSQAFGHDAPISINPANTRPAVDLPAGPPDTSFLKECQPVTNIKVEMLQGGKALVSWDAIPGVPKYFVKLTDENQNVLLDTITPVNNIMVNGLAKGRKYKFSVCYLCSKTNNYVCAYKTFRYIIIEDQVVMLDGSSSSCNCDMAPGTEGACSSSQSSYYTLETQRIYNIHLTDGVDISFVCTGTVNPVGNCPMNFSGMNTAVHGDFGLDLPFYQIGNSRIYFHGSTFCVMGEDVAAITYCDVPAKEKADQNDPVAGELVYPNPFSDIVVVDIAARGPESAETTIRLLNATGVPVLEKTTRDTGPVAIPTESVAPGLYWLSISGEGRERTVERLLKVQ
jgi:hypothetical protein